MSAPKNDSLEAMAEAMKKYRTAKENFSWWDNLRLARKRAYEALPEVRAAKRAYDKAYNALPQRKAYKRAYDKVYRQVCRLIRDGGAP